eukprot:12775934-Heterocapsa_arctica.AAC.1
MSSQRGTLAARGWRPSSSTGGVKVRKEATKVGRPRSPRAQHRALNKEGEEVKESETISDGFFSYGI